MFEGGPFHLGRWEGVNSNYTYSCVVNAVCLGYRDSYSIHLGGLDHRMAIQALVVTVHSRQFPAFASPDTLYHVVPSCFGLRPPPVHQGDVVVAMTESKYTMHFGVEYELNFTDLHRFGPTELKGPSGEHRRGLAKGQRPISYFLGYTRAPATQNNVNTVFERQRTTLFI